MYVATEIMQNIVKLYTRSKQNETSIFYTLRVPIPNHIYSTNYVENLIEIGYSNFAPLPLQVRVRKKGTGQFPTSIRQGDLERYIVIVVAGVRDSRWFFRRIVNGDKGERH